jgi:peptidyl-prolyl cis-trans isomerase D
MISLFRNFFKSKIGLPIFIGFLIIVALAFAAGDITGSSTFGGLTGDEQVAAVGDERISANELTSTLGTALDRARDENPTITMQQFLEGGALEGELDLLLDRYAVGIFAERHGLRAGKNLINSEILKIGAFRSLTGDFDQATYQAALRNQGITDAILRRDIGQGLLAQQLLRPAFAAPQMPKAAARQYAALVLERRKGQIALISSMVFAPQGAPTDSQLQTFYGENQTRFILPERRTIRFADFGADTVNDNVTANITPTAPQIAARFERDKAQYAASERRAISSFVVPTQPAAAALVARIRAGTSLEAAAAEAGFNISSGDLRSREDIASSTSFALSEAVFAAERGKIAEPARSTLGWYVARVDDVEQLPARSLADAREDIAAQLQDEARTAALIDLSAQIEEMVDTGSSLTDVATEFGLEITSIPQITADGQVFGAPGQSIGLALRPILDTTFQMDERKPQLAELVPGAQFLVFDVAEITESAAPPIGEVRANVVAAWRLSEGSKGAKEAANRILAAMRAGKDLESALSAENAALDQIENINIERRQLMAGGTDLPAPLVLLFSMAQGSTKVLEDANDIGWYVVDLDTITTDPIADNLPLLEQTRQQLAPALVAEYNQQLARAIRKEVGVERNEEAIANVRRALAGGR